MYPYASLATVAIGLLCAALVYNVGRARGVHKVAPPEMDGPLGLRVALRIHANTLEQVVIALPALWLCAIWIGDLWAGIGGGAWVVARVVYAIGYSRDATHRLPGFVASFLIAMAMLAAAAIAILRA